MVTALGDVFLQHSPGFTGDLVSPNDLMIVLFASVEKVQWSNYAFEPLTS